MRHAGNFNPECGYIAPAPNFPRTERGFVVAALADLFAYLIVLVTGRTAFRSPRSRSEHVNPWHFHQF